MLAKCQIVWYSILIATKERRNVWNRIYNFSWYVPFITVICIRQRHISDCDIHYRQGRYEMNRYPRQYGPYRGSSDYKCPSQRTAETISTILFMFAILVTVFMPELLEWWLEGAVSDRLPNLCRLVICPWLFIIAMCVGSKPPEGWGRWKPQPTLNPTACPLWLM